MKEKCPNCRCDNEKTIISYNDGSDNIDGLGHTHLECKECGRRFNVWDCGIEKLKTAFGEIVNQYI